VETIREGRDFKTMDMRFYISSCAPAAAPLLGASRKHWAVESALQAHKVEIKGIISKCCKAVGKMMVGPSKSAVRSRFQTTPSGCH